MKLLAKRAPTVAGPAKPERPARSWWAVVTERALEVLMRLAGISAIVFVLAIFFFVFREALPVLYSDNFNLTQFLFSTEWYPTSATNVRYGILALMVGTACVSGLAVLIAVPFSLGPAIFISEFCRPKLKEALKIVIELLAAIPSVVWGFIGLTVTSRLIMHLTGAPVGVNVLNGGVILALMCVPIITSISEDALKAAPDTYREACWNVGATRWQTIRRIALPNSISGILTGVILEGVPHRGGYGADHVHRRGLLQSSRARRPVPVSVDRPVYGLVNAPVCAGDTQVPGVKESLPYATAVVLVLLVLRINTTSISLRVWLRAWKKW